MPQGSSFAWELSNRVGNFIDNDVWGRPGDSKGGIRIYRGGYIYRELTLTVYTPNGCTKSYTKGFNVVEPIAPPQIALVYPDGNKNMVAWETSSLPADAAQVVIYKEGSALNNFIEIGRVNTSENTFTDPSSNNTVRSDRYAISAVTASGVETAKSGIHKTMHLTINRGVANGTWNLIWNSYEGREIGTYRILQGATPDNLTNVLDEISGANTSFTQFDNPDAPYYAVEYIPSSAQVRSARLRSGGIFLAGEIPTSGRTNVVNSNNAATIVYVSNMNILALGNDDVLKEENPSIYLYTELFPSNASYQNIAWSITSGNQYATINSSGNLQATGNTQGGQVTVKAAAVDGSEVFATRTFSVQAFSEAPQPIDPPYNLQTQVNGNQVTFSWQGYSNKYRITVADEEYNGFNEIVSSTTLTRTLPVSVGSYAWRVVSLSDDEADSTSDWTVGTDFIVTGSTTVLDPPHTANTNVSENEVTFTWQGSTNKYRIVVVDEVTLEGFNEVVTGTQLIRELPSGNYMWRIASLSDDENSQSDWTEWAYFTVSGIVGIDNPASGNVVISIYPNPVKDILRIESGETAFGGSQLTITNVEIIDLSGKQLISQQSPSSQINVSNLVQGVYFIKIETDNGVLIEKFIKE